jgi:lipid-binding SYLF domain-containing protein
LASRLHDFDLNCEERSIDMRAIGFIAIASALVLGCAHAPTKEGERADLTAEAHKALDKMTSDHPELRSLLDNSVGYIVFPRVGSGGFLIGGGHGSGVLFENGQVTGYASISKLAVGALAGGQSYKQLVIIQDPKVLRDIKEGRYDFGASASAVILKEGAAANAEFKGGTAVIVEPIKGAMVNASLNGQKIKISM